MDEANFQSQYRRFIERLVAPLIKFPFRFQRKPGIRIHLPAVLMVQFHTDEWYGHEPDVVNFWMPLTDAFDSNTLFVATLEDYLREVARLESEKASMEIVNDDLAEILQPLTSTYGRVHVFNAKVVHGSKPNQISKTRVSLDFLILPKGADPGLKPIDEYYTTLQSTQPPANASVVSPDGSRACSYLFGAHGFMRHISTANHRLICDEFARKYHIQIIAEEIEIRTMTHHPTLLALAEGTGTRSLRRHATFFSDLSACRRRGSIADLQDRPAEPSQHVLCQRANADRHGSRHRRDRTTLATIVGGGVNGRSTDAMKTILITGALGHIGSRLIHSLVPGEF